MTAIKGGMVNVWRLRVAVSSSKNAQFVAAATKAYISPEREIGDNGLFITLVPKVL